MSRVENAVERDAVTRLYELARDGHTGNGEYQRLESMVYERLLQTYASGEPPVHAMAMTRHTAD